LIQLDIMEYKDYYKLIGVARDATPDEIKRAYRQLARKYHPDVSKEKNAEARFKELGEAYEVLKDPEKRAAYDRLGSHWQAGQDFTPHPDANAGFEFSSGSPNRAGNPENFSDFFESLFGRGFTGRTRNPTYAQGDDRHAKILIDLEDSYRGANRPITLQVAEADENGRQVIGEHKINVKIPKGIGPGQQIRLAGQGGPGMGHSRPGDLYLEVQFRSHPYYRVEKHDVYLEVPITPWEAILGATVKVPTPNGTVELQIPAGSTGGNKLRLKGRGLPGSSPGDFYVVLQIALPPADNNAAKEFYRNMSKQFPAFNPRAGLGV
jgi:curved DNA-binding protein